MPPQQHLHQGTKHITSIYESLVVVPPPPPKYTLNEWNLDNIMRQRTCLDQQRLADSIIAETDRAIDEVQEKTENNKNEVDHATQEKIMDVDFCVNESERQRKEVCIEMDNLQTFCERIQDFLRMLEKVLEISKKCLIQRERRLGIDLCYDEVEAELKREYNVINGAIALVTSTLQQANEQIRRLRSTFYFMDLDLEHKSRTKEIDYHNSCITNTSLNLSIYHGFSPLDPSNITLQEWEKFNSQTTEKAGKEITTARQLRSYVDTLLKQATDDLKTQYHATNNAFRRRIEQMKDSKTKMEVQHSEIMRQANEMGFAITRLQKSLAEKEGYMALAHTRLGNRAQRQGHELCKDLVELSLAREVAELRQNCALLQHKLAEAKASLRYLLKTQIQLEEDINIKTNTLKIDEVDCMTLRQGMDYHLY